MGILNFFKFTLLLIEFLAWPVFALGYPLCASIRAIESGSKYHMRKLVIYWTIFSLISLFELAFIKLIEWIPLWYSIKSIAICWLVMPRFHGACYVYQTLVNPCLSVNVRALVSRICKRNKEQSLTTETLVSMTERYIKENGSEAFENLMKSKISNTLYLKCKEADNVQKDIQPESIDKIDAATIEQPKCKEPEVAEKDINASEPPEKIASTTEEQLKCKEADNVQKDIQQPELIDKIVAATIQQPKCKEPEVPEKNINASELSEKIASTTEEQLKCKKADNVQKDIQHPESIDKIEAATIEQLKCKEPEVADKDINASELPKKIASTTEEQLKCKEADNVQKDIQQPESIDKIVAATIQQPKWKEPEVAEKDIKASESPEKIASTTEEQSAEAKISEKIMREEAYDRVLEAPVKKVEREWACALCQVTTTSENDLNSHLLGSKHKSKCDELKRSEQDTKSRGSSPFVTNKSKPGDHEPEKGNIGEGSKQNYANSDQKRGRIDFVASIDGRCWIYRESFPECGPVNEKIIKREDESILFRASKTVARSIVNYFLKPSE